jgi:hypothetical protein
MKRRGFTVIEAQVACSLMLIVLCAIYAVLRPGFGYFKNGNVHAGLQQEVLKGMLALKSDLMESHSANIHSDTTPVAHAWFLSSRPPAGTSAPVQFGPQGQLVWRKWWGYFHEPVQRKLVRAEIELTPATDVVTPPPVPVPTLLDFQNQTGPRRKIICGSLESFAVTRTTGSRYRIQVRSTEAVASDKSTSVELDTEVWVRNQ